MNQSEIEAVAQEFETAHARGEYFPREWFDLLSLDDAYRILLALTHRGRGDGARRIAKLAMGPGRICRRGYPRFVSISLQRGVCEPSVPRIGFKPSVGGLNRGGSYDYFSESCTGVLAASLEDAWLVAINIAVRAGGDPGYAVLQGPPDPPPPQRPRALAVLQTAGWNEAAPEARFFRRRSQPGDTCR
jgi:hypothetical protein